MVQMNKLYFSPLRTFCLFHRELVFPRHFCSKVQDILNRTDRLNECEDDTNIKRTYKSIMQRVPQPVAVVTSGYYDKTGKWEKRGMTCTSFTNVSFNPPILSICLKIPSRMHDTITKSRQFAVHTIARHQVSYGMNFAQSFPDKCQFEGIPHYEGSGHTPIILGCCSVMECKADTAHLIGDHHVWYGEVQQAHVDDNVSSPMLYQARYKYKTLWDQEKLLIISNFYFSHNVFKSSPLQTYKKKGLCGKRLRHDLYFWSFRSVGDEIFIQSFEDATLPFENWTHEAHLRMAWNYIREHGRDGAEPMIKKGIKKFNEANKDKIKTGYHETITMFYTFLVADAVNKTAQATNFEEFLKQNGHLLDRSLMYKYYSTDRFSLPEAKTEFVLPDKLRLPGFNL